MTRLPLWFKYTLSVLSITLALSYLSGEVVRTYETKYLEDRMDAQIRANFSALTEALSEDVLTQQTGALNAKLDRMAQHYPDLCYISIVSQNDSEIGQWGDRPHDDNPMALNFSNLVEFDGRSIGTMRISMSKKQMMADISKHVEEVRIYSAGLLLTLALLTMVVSQYLVLLPLSRINKRLVNMSYTDEILDTKSDELMRLNKGVNVLERLLSQHVKRESELMEAKKTADSANIAKSQFIATMSHEIRTPMNAIMGALDILQEAEIPAHCQPLVEMADDAANLLLNQLNDVLDYSKIDIGALDLHETEFDVSELSKNVLALFHSTAKEKGIELLFDDELNHRFLATCDKGKLSQVLTNLISNAMKFTDDGEIEIVLSHGFPRGLKIQVRDSGIGIAPEHRKIIFEPFTQKDGTFSRIHGGTGMGLAISQRLIALMGGELTLCSQVGDGSEFTVLLPCDMRFPEESDVKVETRKAYRTEDAVNILIVEDNPANQLVARTILEISGFNVTTASNGIEAIDAIKQTKFALVLMDLQMPEMDGFEACKEIRELDEQSKTLPILAMTANVSQQDRDRCKRVGMDDFIAKPVNRRTMLDIIDNWMGKQHEIFDA
ncbi:response regulator [Enterovibrio sp. ZSDZ35]|uniref:histidine kinase n=1 Tax=Enterovibrio qingdaonensis TaxID=2899818 RepID=A0ABT5QQW1_9GAMM|nr:response regulator [Enterovibrio sp. ZSDZ35]MDD1783369.1 response regulator [Enterovibrio sp. ZSDZ35]